MNKSHKPFVYIALSALLFCLGLPSSSTGANLVQYFTFDDGAGAVATNTLAAGNTAQLVNADTSVAWITTGLAPQLTNSTAAITLDGVDDFINLGQLHLSGRGTISFWVNPSSLGVGDIRIYSPVTPTFTPNLDSGGFLRVDTFGTAQI